jgi:hypothetical protein
MDGLVVGVYSQPQTATLLLNGAFSAAYLVGAMSTREFVVLLSLVSFRVTGSYVLLTIVNQPFPVPTPPFASLLLLSACALT